MSNHRERIGLAGLLFLHYLQETSFHKDTANTITKFVNSFHDIQPTTPQAIVNIVKDVKDPIAYKMATELIKTLIAGDTKRLADFNTISPSIHGLYDTLTQAIVPLKTPGKDITGTLIPMPGDIISFLKILFLSLFDNDLYTEIEVFIKSIRPSYTPRDTIAFVNKYIADRRITPHILNMLVPEEKMIGSVSTQNLDIKIKIIQNIIQLIPPS